MIVTKSLRLLALVLLSCLSLSASAWGNRGHHEVCVAATHLIKDAELGLFMKWHQHRIGHLCNVPDIYWKDLPREIMLVGNPTHFINADKAGETLESLPESYAKLLQKKKDPEMASKVGSIWWRADQFYRRALEAAKKAKKLTPPKNIIEQQKRDLPFNRAVFEMQTNMGLMGHFVGDVMMPYHNQSDYDGWKSGRGGIHGFYEETCVATYDDQFLGDIIASAKSLKPEGFLDPKKSIVEKMRRASILSVSEVPQIVALDSLIKESQEEGRVRAERRNPQEACPVFRSLTVNQMARAAALLAQIWDRLYAEARKPSVGLYKSYEYPFTPDFVEPDYLN